MTALRQDAWSPDDDLILAEVILRHIREGSTQLNAFEEVGERIGRTAAACGFRWNSLVRKKYEAAIKMAKGQRQKNQMSKKQRPAVPKHYADDLEDAKHEGASEETITIDAVIRYLRQWKNTVQETGRQIKALEKKVSERDERIEELQNENAKLQKQVDEVETDYRIVNDDYRALIQIMDRARKLAFLAEAEEENKPRFKMDANGNLERIE